jgi:activator of HSP90 ATPase
MSRKVGGKFEAFEGQLKGKNLLIVPGKRIVQLWRATHWKKADWSILILTFSPVAGGAQVDLVHVGVPAYDHKGVGKAGRNIIGTHGRNTSANPPRSSSSPPPD